MRFPSYNDKYTITYGKKHSMLNFNPKDNTFSIEVSDFAHNFFNPLFPIVILMPNSGNSKTFFLNHQVKDREGEITHWEYKTLETSGFQLIVLND